jgi:hypothetical protein
MDNLRVLSEVYYFHAKPKASGALRPPAIGDAVAQTFVDIEPMHNIKSGQRRVRRSGLLIRGLRPITGPITKKSSAV